MCLSLSKGTHRPHRDEPEMQFQSAMRTLGSGRSKGWSRGVKAICIRNQQLATELDGKIGRAPHSPVGLSAGPA
jgi:hypothetical protein